MMMKRLTKLSFKWHGWLGLTLGFFFLLYGLSGSVLVFRHELDRFCHPGIHQLHPGHQRVSADAMYRMMLRGHPNLKKLVLHDFPRDQYDCYEFMLYHRQQHLTENYLFYAFVDPYTGKIIQEGGHHEFLPFFVRWLYTLHYSLQMGIPGMLCSALLGLLMLCSLLTGLIVYRKHFWKTLLFRQPFKFRNWRSATSSLHRIIGVWSLLFNILLFFTGFWMLREYFDPSMWVLQKPQKNVEVKANIDLVIQRSEATVPGFKPIAVNIPTSGGHEILVRGHMPGTQNPLLRGKANSMVFDAATGQLKKLNIIDQQDFSTRFEYMAYQLHAGGYAGLMLKWIYVIFGLSPALLSITGAVLWFKRCRFNPNKS